MEYLLETDHLIRKFGTYKAVDDVNLHVNEGQIYGFIGRNGAGKTTTLKIISGLLRPTSGKFSLLGESSEHRYSKGNFKDVGVLIEAPGIYPHMTAFENLKTKCLCIGRTNNEYINGVLDLVGLGNVSNKKVINFSLGMKQRLGIALALLGDPKLLVLDEPINGLDPQGIVEVRDLILRINKEKNITIIISSHILGELEKIATNYGIINEGKLLLEVTKDELIQRCSDKVVIKVDQIDNTIKVLKTLNIFNYVVKDTETIDVYENNVDLADINISLLKEGIRLKELRADVKSLEDIYFDYTGGQRNA